MAIKLTAELIEGFVVGFLQPRFDHPCPTAPFHREAWKMVSDEKDRFVAIAAPRGHAKTTAITQAYTLANVLFGARDFVLIVSNTYDISVKFLGDIKSELKTNDELILEFGPIKFIKDTEDEIIVQCAIGMFCIIARGAEQKLRGLKWKNKRPNLILGDDLEDDEMVANPDRRAKFRNWALRSLRPLGGKTALHRIVGTILHFDSYLERLMHDKTWVTKRYRAHEGFDDFSNILWPGLWTEADLRDERQAYIEQGNSDGYSQEFLNFPMTEEDAFFRQDDFIPMRPADYESEKHFVIACDLALTKDQRSDYTVFVVAGIDDQGVIHIVDVRRKRIAADEIVDEMIALTIRYRPQLFGVAKGGHWEGIRPFVEKRMRETRTYIPFELISDAKDKVAKAKAIQGFTRMSMVRYDVEAAWYIGLFDEMGKFTNSGAKSGHDDQVDAMAVLGNIIENSTRPDTPEEADEEEYRNDSHEHVSNGRCSITGY